MTEFTTISVQNRQTLDDLAVQYYGGQDGQRQLLVDNRKLLPEGLSTQLYEGMLLKIRVGEPADVKTLAEVQRLDIKPATGLVRYPEPDYAPDHNLDHNPDHSIPE